MPLAGFDHAAIPTSNAKRFLEFYKALGFSIIVKWTPSSGQR